MQLVFATISLIQLKIPNCSDDLVQAGRIGNHSHPAANVNKLHKNWPCTAAHSRLTHAFA